MTNAKRKETAGYFLYDCGLLEELKKYGKPHIIGSYRMDMMAWNDLDIDIENDNMSMEQLYQLTSFILDRFHPTWYEAKQELAEDGERVWFQGFETMITGELWNFDLWFFSKKKIEAAERYCDDIVKNTTPFQKQRIIQIKEQLIARDLYSFEQYTSMDVYRAVMEQGVDNVEDFLLQYNKAEKQIR